jgi:hypothetical protein
MAQSIDLSGVSGEIAVTLLVIRVSPDILGESRGCVRCVLPTAESRFNELDRIGWIYWYDAPLIIGSELQLGGIFGSVNLDLAL